jgi:hypothetical protein
MESQIMTVLSPDELSKLIKKAVREVEDEKADKATANKSYSINQAAKELGRSFTTVKNLITDGTLKTTAAGRRIPVNELKRYMGQAPTPHKKSSL